MPDRITRLLLETLQPRPGRGGWHGGPTPAGALRGVTAAQAAWTPAPGRKSIWQLALHIAYWKYAVRRRLEGGTRARFPRTPANWPCVPDPADDRAWAQDIALLKTESQRLVATIAALPVSRYGVALPGGKRWTVGELILGIAQHDAYHTGQIQMLKRLCGATHPAPQLDGGTFKRRCADPPPVRPSMRTSQPATGSPADAETQLAGFIAKFEPEHQTLIRAVRKALRKRFPTAFELAYDNYNFFVLGYGPTDRPSDCIVSMAAGANGIGLCFIHGASLPDPMKVLLGSGNQTRFIRLVSVAVLGRPEVRALLTAAVARANTPLPPSGGNTLIIRSVSAKQRPRRKAAK